MRALLVVALAFGVLAVAGIGYWAWFVGIVNHENDAVDAFVIGFGSGVLALVMWLFSLIDTALTERRQKMARVLNQDQPLVFSLEAIA